MAVVGIVCEYNPFHLGHERQLRAIRGAFGADVPIVCAMSGNFVQRGAPALVDKSRRAAAAVACGASLVVELPVAVSLSSAEGFAAGAVAVLSRLCDTLCFGTETADRAALDAAAQALLDPSFGERLRRWLDTGVSFPAARQRALEELGLDIPLTRPNDILAVEYRKATLAQASPMDIFPIHRPGSYHADTPDPENPSATAVRRLMLAGTDWRPYVPENARPYFENAPLHTLAAGERAVLARLRTMTEAEFAALPYGSEGLWRRLMHASRREPDLEAVLTAVKSKRYTRSRLDRMALCAFLGITKELLEAPAPYVRVLAFDQRGRELLNRMKKTGFFRNPGDVPRDPCWLLEQRAGDLYGLFALNAPEPPGAEQTRRVVCFQA